MTENKIINMTYKPIRLVTPDGNAVEFDQQTSEALYLYAQAKGITVEQTIDEVFKRFIQLKKENEVHE